MIRELRALTSAGMKDCKDSLEESNWDLSKAVDIIKTKGLNIADGRSGRAASEGIVSIYCGQGGHKQNFMAEINCQTDFVANSPDFKDFVHHTMDTLCSKRDTFQISDVEMKRQALVAITKENIVVRRWWIEEAVAPNARIFSYLHSNNKIGVILTLQAPDIFYREADRAVLVPKNLPEFIELGDNLAMQVAAMNPLAIDIERLAPEAVTRQQAIFEQQLTDQKKPQAAWPKILEGKFRKWQTEVCLMEQESVWVPKTSVKQVIANTETIIGGPIKIVTMIRCQVGENIEVKKDNLDEEVAKLIDQENNK